MIARHRPRRLIARWRQTANAAVLAAATVPLRVGSKNSADIQTP